MNVVILGIISSVIASLAYAIISLTIRPRIDTSDIICVSQENGRIIYKIKVVNRTRARLMNIWYTLDYCEDFDDGITVVSDILPRKGVVTTIEKYNKKNTDYAVRISFDVDPNQFPFSNNVRLVFTITATHPFSNTSICKKKIYRSDALRNAKFESGKSMGYINN